MANNSKFITVPDIIPKEHHTVLMIDSDWEDIETVAYFCKSCQEDFTIYLYQAFENNKEWLMDAFANCDTVLINNVEGKLSAFLNKMLSDPHAFYFGEKIEGKDNFYNNPVEYFIEYAYKQQTNDKDQ